MGIPIVVDVALAALATAESWQFKLGQCISHKDQSMPSLVMTRQKAGRLGEVYGVRSFAVEDPNRDRMILGDSLVHVVVGSTPCGECLLFRTSMCVGALTDG